MEKKVTATAAEAKIKSSFILPPNVNGRRCRGKLSLCLHEIQWLNVAPIQFNWIEAKFLWWGNHNHSAATIKLKNQKNRKKSIGDAIHYDILTKFALFQKYLIGSEKLIVKLASGISNIEIGQAVIVIPNQLIEFIDKLKASSPLKQSDSHTQTITRKFPITSNVIDAHQRVIGEILMDFDMVVYDQMHMCNEMELKADALTAVPQQQQFKGIENNMNHVNKMRHKSKNKSMDKLSLNSGITANEKPIPHERMPLSSTTATIAQTKRISSKSVNVSSPLLNYLTGRPLHAAEETEAVQAMASTSPTESLIDQLSYDLNGLYLPKKPSTTTTTIAKDCNESDLLKKIDCMRIHINDLCLTRAGIREILSNTNASSESTFGSGTFTVSIDFDPVLLATIAKPSLVDESNATFSSEVIRIFDTSIETIPPVIEFNRSSVHKLNKFCMKSQSVYANGRISLNVQYRDIESHTSQTLGTAQFQLDDIINATNLTFQQQCPVTIASSEIICGRLSINAELGCRGLHFGVDFLEAISIDSINTNTAWRQSAPITDHDQDCFGYNCYRNCHSATHHCCLNNSKYSACISNDLCSCNRYLCTAHNIHDEQTEDKSQTPSGQPLNTSQPQNTMNSIPMSESNDGNSDSAQNNGNEHSLKLNQMDELSSDTDENTLKGLFHVGQINYCSWYQSTADTFLVCRPFWIADTALITENCQHKINEENYQLNYLELFSVICDQKLLDATKHGFMSIEIWQRDSNHKIESLIGSAKVPLHQFYIAFNNNIIRTHVNKQELPVISIDGWITIAYASLPDSTPVGTVQALLAVGTTKQLNNLKKSKSLSAQSTRCFLRYPLDLYTPQVSHIGVTGATNVGNKAHEPLGSHSIPNGTSGDGPESSEERHNNLKSMFSTFIDNLAAKLPERNLTSMNGAVKPTTTTSDATTQTNVTNNDTGTPINPGSGKYMRPTSELLEDLHRALAITPTPNQKNGYGLTSIPQSEQHTSSIESTQQAISHAIPKNKMFYVHIEIETALHLPTIQVMKKGGGAKRHRNVINASTQNKSNGNGNGNVSSSSSSSSGTSNTTIEMEPNTYVTFEAAATNVPTNATTYTTNIVETSCSPRWNKQFEVYLSAEYLQNDDKRFEVRVWRKVGDNTSKMRLIPNPSNDVTIGLASIDLSVLIAGLPFISGWFNIIDHSGCINGQLKVHIKSKTDLSIYQRVTVQRPIEQITNNSNRNDAATETPSSVMENELTSEHKPFNSVAPVSALNRAIDDSALSRALKRKFTELEEITQRLRARLFDVTGNIIIDPDDQFENDLNTIPDEGDDNFEESNLASEMSLDWLEHCHNQAEKIKTIYHHEHDNDNALSTAQMRDIFEYLSTTDSNQSLRSFKEMDAEQSIDSLPDKLHCRFNEVLNEEQKAWSKTSSIDSNNVENSIDNIAETLKQKSLIND